jgi:hypothetical protein
MIRDRRIAYLTFKPLWKTKFRDDAKRLRESPAQSG